jgi:oligopeptide transport system substrate-binding protein
MSRVGQAQRAHAPMIESAMANIFERIFFPSLRLSICSVSAWARSALPTLRLLLLFLLLTCSAQLYAADPNKILRVALPTAETDFDPVIWADQPSAWITESIFDPMLQYDYLARPAKLIPNTLSKMPEVRDDGATFIFSIKSYTYFTPDKVFKGQKRELTAHDYAYTLRRIFDPKNKSQWLFLFEGKIRGADAAMAKAKKENRFDYDAPIEGIEVIDRYTLRVRLNKPDYKFLFNFALPATSAMAREVVEAYGADLGAHPVGTGPFMLKEWKRSSKIVLEANPDYREEIFQADTKDFPGDEAIVHALNGKKLPNVGRVEVYVVEEPQPRWLAFLNGEHDYVAQVPDQFVSQAVINKKVAPHLARKGIHRIADEEAHMRYTSFNMEHPITGGYTPDKIALRRAIGLAYNVGEELSIIRKDQALRIESPFPPAVIGYDPTFKSSINEYSPAKAKALLDLFGYVDKDGDGWRDMPDGSPLDIEIALPPTAEYRPQDELWKKCMSAVGIKMRLLKVKLEDLRKMVRMGEFQINPYGWVADYPDGENFLQLLTTSSINQGNYARFSLPEYDKLYEQAASMPDSPERQKLYQRMVNLMLVYAPWKLQAVMQRSQLAHPWVLGYKKHPFMHHGWRYVDIDLQKKAQASK